MSVSVNNTRVRGVRGIAALIVLLCSAMALTRTSPALASSTPQWTISVTSEPTNFVPGGKGDEYVVTAVNTGAAATNGTTIRLRDQLPTGIAASGISGSDLGKAIGFAFTPLSCELSTLECTYTGVVTPGEAIRMVIVIEVGNGAGSSVGDTAVVSGGGAAEAAQSIDTPITVVPPNFGIVAESFRMVASTAQAGAHPSLTTIFALNQREIGVAAGSPKDIGLDLPPGLIGDPMATPRCTMTDVLANRCPEDAVVGVATVSTEIETYNLLVYNITPYANEPAAFAFSIGGLANVRLDTGVRSDGDYGVRVSIADVSQAAPLVSSSVTLWGVPAEHNGPGPNTATEPFHNPETGEAEFVRYGAFGKGARVPLLTNPTACGGTLPVELSLSSWPQAEIAVTASARTLVPSSTSGFTGCGKLAFEPTLSVGAESFQAGASTGYVVGLGIPQSLGAEGLASADLRDASVTLPLGTSLSPSAANGLAACTAEQFGLHSGVTGHCPGSSTLGTVKIATPLLAQPLEGHVFLGQPACSPCTPGDAQAGRLAPLLLEAEGSGVVIKLAGRTAIDQETDRLTTTFTENPQLPFSDLELSLKGGENAPLTNPSTCGPAVAVARLTPWSALTTTEVSAPPIPISGCSPPGFSPSLRAGMTSTAQAGAFSPFGLTLSRPDGQRDFRSATVTMPPGLLGTLSEVPLCGEAQANAGTCPVASQIGSVTVVLGPGSLPLTVFGGKVYLTGPYGGAPFGLSIVVPAQAGPFVLAGNTAAGTEVVRASIAVDPHTDALTISSAEVPSKLDGIPLDLRTISVEVDRTGFMFNPTNCDPSSIRGSIQSTAGDVAGVSFPFQSVNCATLPFRPTFSVHTRAKHSRRNGASLSVVVESGSGQANIGSVRVALPRLLPSRLSTLNQACPEATFNANPAQCPAGSRVGGATAHTPVLPVPLSGPAYFVSHGGAKFPELILVLQGDGVTIDLAGETFISKGVTTSTFRSLPDAPISRFDLNLPTGPHSAITASGNLCRGALTMPTTIKGQNGAVFTQNTRVAVSGCPRPKAAVHRHRPALRRKR